MLKTPGPLLKKRYRKAIFFQAISMISAIFCFFILLIFIYSITKNAIMPLKSVEIRYTHELESFIATQLEHQKVDDFFPKSVKYQSDKLEVFVPVKYDFKKFILINHTEKPYLTQDYQRLKSFALQNNLIKQGFNWNFFTKNNSIYPEISGIKGATVGSIYVLLIFVTITIPIGILVGLYISEFLKQGKLQSILKINIQNLASIPSIIYGIIVLNIFVNIFEFNRASALVGGIALSLLILPMIIMITYNAAAMVPQGYKDAALSLGLSNVQSTFIITLQLSMPRIITGILLAIARAAGETAPLIILGMAFFSSEVPKSFINEASTTLPLQIFLWTGDSQEAFIEYASAGIMVFIIFLTTINFAVHLIRNKLQKS
jgi:phosphate transport system permease protein